MPEASRPTGDVQNALGKLSSVLSRDPFKSHLPEGHSSAEAVASLDGGSNPVPALQLLHTCALGASAPLSAFLLASSGQPLLSATDQRFVEELFRLARNELSYMPPLSVSQFLTPGSFAEQRLLLLSDLLRLLQLKHDQLVTKPGPTRKQVVSTLSVLVGINSSNDAKGLGDVELAQAGSVDRALSRALIRELKCDAKQLLPFKAEIAKAAGAWADREAAAAAEEANALERQRKATEQEQQQQAQLRLLHAQQQQAQQQQLQVAQERHQRQQQQQQQQQHSAEPIYTSSQAWPQTNHSNMQASLSSSKGGKGKGRASDRASHYNSTGGRGNGGGRGEHTSTAASTTAAATAEARAVRAEEAVAALRAQVDALQKAQAFSGGGNGDGGASAFMESEVEARVARRAAERVAGALRAELGDALAEACGGLERRIVDQLYLVENRVRALESSHHRLAADISTQSERRAAQPPVYRSEPPTGNSYPLPTRSQWPPPPPHY